MRGIFHNLNLIPLTDKHECLMAIPRRMVSPHFAAAVYQLGRFEEGQSVKTLAIAKI